MIASLVYPLVACYAPGVEPHFVIHVQCITAQIEQNARRPKSKVKMIALDITNVAEGDHFSSKTDIMRSTIT